LTIRPQIYGRGNKILLDFVYNTEQNQNSQTKNKKQQNYVLSLMSHIAKYLLKKNDFFFDNLNELR
jgi:hypothetical protein